MLGQIATADAYTKTLKSSSQPQLVKTFTCKGTQLRRPGFSSHRRVKSRPQLPPCHADWSKFADRINLNSVNRRKGRPEGPVPNNNKDPVKYTDGGTGWGNDWEQDWDPNKVPKEYLQEQAGGPGPRRKDGDQVRDKWLTPLLDWQSVVDALDPDEERTEDRIRKEASVNDMESRDGVRFAVTALFSAWLSGTIVSQALADPILHFTLQHNPHAFELADQQKVECAHKVHIEEFRVKMEVAIGKLPSITDEVKYEHLREFALELQDEEREHNEHSVVNVVADSVAFGTFLTFVGRASNGRRAMLSTIGRVFNGLSDIAKAFIIILVADTFVGYHSAEGWEGFLELTCHHYGVEPNHNLLALFVATVPVTADVWFKYWCFVGLNKFSPEAVVTIKAMNRH